MDPEEMAERAGRQKYGDEAWVEMEKARRAGKPALKRAADANRYGSWGVPTIGYTSRDVSVSHATVERLKADATESEIIEPFKLCETKVPAVMCECRRYFLVMIKLPKALKP